MRVFAMSAQRNRPLSVGPIRAFEAVARHLSFRAAAEELSLTQSAISRQISSLEEELGAPLFSRGTRHVALTSDGQALLRAVVPGLDRLDTTVRHIRRARGRKHVNLNTFASMASMWLIPQMEAFQRAHADIDIRVSATDNLVDMDDGENDLVLRYCSPQKAPAGALRLFGEVLTPVISPWMAARIASGEMPPLLRAADLTGHTLAEEDNCHGDSAFLSWRGWLEQQGHADLQPRRWMVLNYTYQQVQAALTGQAVALARLGLVTEALERGELIEPFGVQGRMHSPLAYWLLLPGSGPTRPEVQQFCHWITERAAQTRRAMGEVA
jgi:LysR family transcriptional regulator, glycine cleavage system transcriptional activator